MKNIINLFKLVLPALALSALVGCSQKFQDVQDTMSLALFGNKDIVIPADKVNALPYASIYAKVDGNAQVFMVLAYAQPAYSALPDAKSKVQLKWLSANNEMLVTEYGRIVKTVNLLSGNISASYSNQADPLALGLLKANTPTRWKRKVDWQPGLNFGYTITSRFDIQGKNILMINDQPVETLHVIEYASAPELDLQFENDFWLDPISGAVLASSQTPAPGLPKIEITLLKPYLSGAQ